MGVVIATGTETEFGVIFSMMQDVSIVVYLLNLNSHTHTHIRWRKSGRLYNSAWTSWRKSSRSCHLGLLESFV